MRFFAVTLVSEQPREKNFPKSRESAGANHSESEGDRIKGGRGDEEVVRDGSERLPYRIALERARNAHYLPPEHGINRNVEAPPFKELVRFPTQ